MKLWHKLLLSCEWTKYIIEPSRKRICVATSTLCVLIEKFPGADYCSTDVGVREQMTTEYAASGRGTFLHTLYAPRTLTQHPYQHDSEKLQCPAFEAPLQPKVQSSHAEQIKDGHIEFHGTFPSSCTGLTPTVFFLMSSVWHHTQ